jgi:hypothetical protein
MPDHKTDTVKFTLPKVAVGICQNSHIDGPKFGHKSFKGVGVNLAKWRGAAKTT